MADKTKLFYNLKKDEDNQFDYLLSYIEGNEVKTDKIHFDDYFVVQKTPEVEKEVMSDRNKAVIKNVKIEKMNNKDYYKIYLNLPLSYKPTPDEEDLHKQVKNFVYYNIAKKFKAYEYDVYPAIIKIIYENKIQFLKEDTKVEEVPYCVFDIETQTSGSEFPRPENNFIFYIGARGVNAEGKSVTFYKSVADYTDKQEEYGTIGENQMLIDFLKFLDENKFVILSGYNIYNFDLYFIDERLKLHGLKFAFNGDEIYLNRNPNRPDGTQRHPLVKFQNPQYKQYVSKNGRIVIFDIFYYMFRTPTDRQNIKYKYGLVSLKNVSDYFGVLKKKERVLIEGTQIYPEFLKNPKHMTQYLVDDVESTHSLYVRFFPIMLFISNYSNIELSSVFDASSTQILERALYKNMKKKDLYIFPKSNKSYSEAEIRSFGGGMSKLHATGYYRNVIKTDFSSLYPSIMLDWNIKPEDDENNVFIDTLRGLYTERIGYKKEAKKLDAKENKTEEDKIKVSNYKNYSAALKILINSAYGLLGYRSWQDKSKPGSRFSNITAATQVTAIGRNMITSVEDVLLKNGYTLIETDTDGVDFTDLNINSKSELKENVVKLVNEINKSFKDLGKTFASLDIESLDDGMISMKKKNYITFDINPDGSLDISSHGSTLVDSRKPRIIKETVANIIQYMIEAPSLEAVMKKFNFFFISSPLKKEKDFITYCNKFEPSDFFYNINVKEKSSYKNEKLDIEQKVLLDKYIKKYGIEPTADLQLQYFKSTEGVKAREKDELSENFDRNLLDYRTYLKEIKKVFITLLLYMYNLQLVKDTNVTFMKKDNKVLIKDTNVSNPYTDDAVFDKNWYKKIFVDLADEKRHDVVTTINNHKIVGDNGSFFRPLLKNLVYPPSALYKTFLDKTVKDLSEDRIKKLKIYYYGNEYSKLKDNSEEKIMIQKDLSDDELYLFDTSLFEEYFKKD